jgi:hemerythrin-like domain-containing protein
LGHRDPVRCEALHGCKSLFYLMKLFDGAHLRQHVESEDDVLYSMAKACLPASAWEGIAKRFKSFEEDQTGSGEHERLHELAEDLIRRYGGGPAHPLHPD